MNLLKSIPLAATLLVALTAIVFAGTFTKGTVKKIDIKSEKVTVIHEELVDLGMPAMTMVFRLARADVMEKLSEGREIELVADRVNGKLTVVELK